VRTVPRILLLLVSAKLLIALDPALAISQYLHTNWTQEQGADLPGVQAIVQTAEGYLWLGTTNGLIRFDGIRFVHWTPLHGQELPSTDIRLLAASRSRGLWIGSSKSVSRLENGQLTAYPAVDSWLHGTPISMFEDRLGRLWILGQGAEGRSVGAILPTGQFEIYDRTAGLPGQKVQTILEDSKHVLWLGTTGGLCRWSPGAPAACSLAALNIFSLTEEANGDFLIGDNASGSTLELSGGVLRPVFSRLGNASVIARSGLRDHDGNVWIGTVGQGLLRLNHGRLERFTRRDGLSSDTISAVAEDREGDLWIATARGIDRIRDPKVSHLNSLGGLSGDLVTAVQPGRGGGVWVGTSGGLNFVKGPQIVPFLMESGLTNTTITALYQDIKGTLWVATSGGLFYRSGNRFVPLRDTVGKSLIGVFAITGRDDGDLAVLDSGKGLFTIRSAAAHSLALPELPPRRAYQIQFDTSGRLWVGYYDGGVAMVDGASVHLYTKADGLVDGSVRAIQTDAAGDVWVGGASGLSRFHNGSWDTWTRSNGLPEGGVNAIVEDVPHRSLWLATPGGLLCVSIAALNGSLAAAGPLKFVLYGANEGLRMYSNGRTANPTMTVSEGKIWLCTLDGVTIVDPARVQSNPLPPPVVIEQMSVDGAALDLASSGSAVFRGRQLQIAYTALSLPVPERIRFRYKLEGLDRDWTEAEGRRTVTYVDLPHGHYWFHVTACNNDGVWNTEGAVLPFFIKPYYYQTWWFLVLCAGVMASLAFGAHRIRVRRVVYRLQLIGEERARLTRELHDSLLQGFAGVVYQLESVARQFDTAPAASKQRLEKAIDQADRSLQEARRTISSMRLPALENHTLPQALTAVASQLTEDAPASFHLEVKGRVQQLPYDHQANLYLIGREAITNAVNHARATRITALLVYSDREVRLTVQDDGAGFDPEVGASKKDHWGMRGMRERAATMGAVLRLDSAVGRGTVVEVVVPRQRG
jgi:signal transduction histidine kinase/ligand-binding sensor domain-containing protein